MTNSSQYGTLAQGTTYYTNYTCPPNVMSLNDCEAAQTDCSSNSGTYPDYVLQCYRPYRKLFSAFLEFIVLKMIGIVIGMKFSFFVGPELLNLLLFLILLCCRVRHCSKH